MKDREKIIEKIATAPDTLSPDEILIISVDDELSELYEGASLMSAALADVPELDTEQGLAELHARMHSRWWQRRLPRWHRGMKAAVTVGIALTAMAVIAAMWFVPSRDTLPADTTKTEQPVATPGQSQQATPAAGKLSYDDAPLRQILHDVALRYGCQVQYVNTQAADSRFHVTLPAGASLQQVADMLNAFDEVKISINDNTLIVE